MAGACLATGVLDVLLLSMAGWRMFLRYPISPSEGWNLAHQAIAASGQSIYSVPGVLAPVNYPPLFFYLTAALPLGGDSLLTGRIIDFVAAVAACGLTGLVARRLGSSRLAALLAVLIAGLLLLTAGRNYVGMDNPHLTASALSLAGLWLYLRTERHSIGSACAVALACALGFAMKQTAVPAALAILLDAWLASRRTGALYTGAMAVAFAALLGVCLALFGRDFVTQMTLGRVYHVEDLQHFNQYMGTLASVVTLAALAAAGQWRRGRPVVLFIAVGCLLAMAGEGGEGTDVNLWFDPYLAIAAGLALVVDIWSKSEAGPRAVKALGLASLTSLLVIAGYRYPGEFWPGVFLFEHDRFRQEVAYLNSFSGPVWCEDLFLCYETGRKIELDTFWVNQLVLTGQLDPEPLMEDLTAGRFEIVQFAAPWPPVNYAHGLPAGISDVLLTRYAFLHDDGNAVFLGR